MSISSHHQIDRSRVNESSVQVATLPKSGFNKSYKTYSAYTMGRLHVGGYHHIMPADKFRGVNSASLTFFNLNQPNVSDVNISQHNFFVTLRSIDKSFESAFAPNVNNAMSASWRAPGFTLTDLVGTILSFISNTQTTNINTFLSTANSHPTDPITTSDITILQSTFSNPNNFYNQIKNDFINHYLIDWVDDVYFPRATALLSSLNSATSNLAAFRIFIDALLFPFIGEGSLIDELGYIYVRRADLKAILSVPKSLKDVVNLFNDTYQNEYALRAYYTIWYEYYRDNNLEPRRSMLSDWHDFSSVSIVQQHISFLAIRFRSWGKDVFTTSMPDDISRHVFAPVLNNTTNTAATYSTSATDYTNAESTITTSIGGVLQTTRNIVSTELSYKDPVTGNLTKITCPIPARVNDALTASTSSALTPHLLDLFTLRNAQSLERYLKRNFYFGDEYRDRMLAHYGSYVSDMRVNRPEFLSSSVSPINPNQVVSSAGTENTPQGERMMTITASTSDDSYNFFAEEFGIVINLISIMPVAQYAGVCPQNIIDKVVDYPVPEFAANNEEFSRVYEISFSGLKSASERIKPTFGHHPYAHSWRARVNEVHKEYLSDLQEHTFRRLFGMDDDARVPVLNSSFIHCKPNLGMFAAGHDSLYTHQVYGPIEHQFYCESVLPTPVEVI